MKQRLNIYLSPDQFANSRLPTYNGVSRQPVSPDQEVLLLPQLCSRSMKRTHRPAFESLERRDVPSAATPSTVNLTAGVLTVLGSASADAISISQALGVISVVDAERLRDADGIGAGRAE